MVNHSRFLPALSNTEAALPNGLVRAAGSRGGALCQVEEVENS